MLRWREGDVVSTEITQVDVAAAYCADQNNALALGCNVDMFNFTDFGDALTVVNVDWDVKIDYIDENVGSLRDTRIS